MNRRIPFIALWVSLVYLVVALAVTSKLCFDQLRALIREASGAAGEGFFSISPAWAVAMADAVLNRLWWMCAATGLGILLIALSVLWVSLSPRG